MGARRWPGTASTASVRRAGRDFAPRDAELALLPGSLPPQEGHAQLAHLGAWMPLAPAAAMLARCTQGQVSAATARRLSEVVGRASAAVQPAEVERLCDELPPVPQGP